MSLLVKSFKSLLVHLLNFTLISRRVFFMSLLFVNIKFINEEKILIKRMHELKGYIS